MYDISAVFRVIQTQHVQIWVYIQNILSVEKFLKYYIIKVTHNSSLCLCDNTMVDDIRTDYFPLIIVCSDRLYDFSVHFTWSKIEQISIMKYRRYLVEGVNNYQPTCVQLVAIFLRRTLPVKFMDHHKRSVWWDNWSNCMQVQD